jgi:Fe-S cluster assembly protein SufD
VKVDVAALAARPGERWDVERRTAAAETFNAAVMPSHEEEIWRYSRVDELDLDLLAAPGDGTTVVSPGTEGLVRAPSDGELGSVMTAPTDVFALLNDARCDTPLVVHVPRGRTVDTPIVIDHHLTAGAWFPRLVILTDDDAEVTVVERFTSGDGAAIVAPVTEIRAAQSARVRYLAINELGPRTWQVGSLVADGERDSSTRLGAVALGGDYARLRIDARLTGRGATGEQTAVYFGEADQMHDFRTLQHHMAPKTQSNLLFKGAVEGRSRSVYTGMIRIGKGATGSAAFQTNRNIKLSADAWAESVPNLDIETNDVKCSHASAVGPIDEEQRFYLESRGIRPEVAERLIVIGFFDEVLSQLPAQHIVDPLRSTVVAKLDRRNDDGARSAT